MTPLRTIHLAGFPLRIYPSPLAMPDHPWVAFDDLAAIAEMDDTDRDTCDDAMTDLLQHINRPTCQHYNHLACCLAEWSTIQQDAT